jgi:hypothetical protein
VQNQLLYIWVLNEVDTVKSSSILIYYNAEDIIYTRKDGSMAYFNLEQFKKELNTKMGQGMNVMGK